MVEVTQNPSAVEQAPHPAYGLGGLNRTETLGMRMRHRPVFRSVRRHRPERFLDLGCGFHADLLAALSPDVPTLVGVDLSIDPVHASRFGITGINGEIVETLRAFEPESFDYISMLSVLEHLPNPQEALDEIHRVLAPDGVAFVHVPTWMGKPVLEVMGFKQGISADGIDDHRTYYRISELWPMVIRAGFRPKHTRMRYGLGGMVLDAEMRKVPSAVAA
jgi:SAM-dependent methyltransferase